MIFGKLRENMTAMSGLLSRPATRPAIPSKRTDLRSSKQSSAASHYTNRMSADIPNAPGHEVSSTVNASDGNVAAGGDIHSHDIDLAQLDGGDNTEVTMDSLVARIQYFEKKIAKVESEKDSYKRKAERREERIAVLKSEVSEPCQDCEELPQVQKQLAKLTEEYDQLQKQTERYYKDAARYYQQCKTLSASKNKLEQDITKLQNGSVGRNRQTEEHVKSLERRIADQEKLLKKAQEDVFNAKDTTDSMVEPDSSINALIKSLERDVKTFAKQHAIKGTGDADLQQFFGADHQIIREMIDEEGMKALGHARVEKNAPSILLSAWLVHEAYRSIAAKPWYFMDEMESRLWKGEEVHIDTGFSRFFSMLHHCKFPHFHEGKMLMRLRLWTEQQINQYYPFRGVQDP